MRTAHSFNFLEFGTFQAMCVCVISYLLSGDCAMWCVCVCGLACATNISQNRNRTRVLLRRHLFNVVIEFYPSTSGAIRFEMLAACTNRASERNAHSVKHIHTYNIYFKHLFVYIRKCIELFIVCYIASYIYRYTANSSSSSIEQTLVHAILFHLCGDGDDATMVLVIHVNKSNLLNVIASFSAYTYIVT